jgi:hypothetical protein
MLWPNRFNVYIIIQVFWEMRKDESEELGQGPASATCCVTRGSATGY